MISISVDVSQAKSFLCRGRVEGGELRERMRELARVRVRFGYRKLHVLLRQEGFGCSFAASCRDGAR